ncbi:MAG: dephospho-CoA kinase [Ornithinimicrobium sp.]|uniref:dephospho-CoA kinase n=1 Tax=Ornithinimicrobium sp. TaxID=1977084 RepID=UPI003D9AD97A
MLRVGLSGGIGSGKSTVSARLAELGAVVVDGDRIAREVVAPGSPGLAEVVRRFGPEVLDADGALNRPALGAIVFADPDARRDLEAITHPLIAERGAELMAAAPAEAVVLHDMPLLVEKGMGSAYHLVVIVGADTDERLRRLVEERGMDPDQARQRMASQDDDAARRAAADVWLDNTGSVAALQAAVDRLWRERLVPFAHHVRDRIPARRPETLRIVAPDPTWPAQAQRVTARLRRALGDTASAVEHIGSTSIPGMPAKDVIDLQVVVRDLADADDPEIVTALADAGFPRPDGEWWDHAHGDDSRHGAETWTKRLHGSADPGRIAHVHVRAADSPARRLALLFRDWVREDSEAHADYVWLKQSLAGQGLSASAYAEAKEPWFAQAFVRAEAWAARSGWSPPARLPPAPSS